MLSSGLQVDPETAILSPLHPLSSSSPRCITLVTVGPGMTSTGSHQCVPLFTLPFVLTFSPGPTTLLPLTTPFVCSLHLVEG